MDVGAWGEIEAEKFLLNLGYSVLAKNYRFKHLEVDLICQKEGFLIAVEVKTRTKDQVVSPLQAVNKTKQKNMAKAINHYAEAINFQGEIRMDVITVVKAGTAFTLSHIEDAFFPFN